MSRSSAWLRAAVTLTAIWTAGGADAQPSGPFDMPDRGDRGRLSLTADQGKTLPLEARFVPGGMYYAAVRVTVVNPAGTSADRVYARASAFRLVTAQGGTFSPADDDVPLRGGAAVANRCGLIYLVSNRPTTCDLVFLLPSGTNSGTLEFAAAPADVVSVPVAFRE